MIKEEPLKNCQRPSSRSGLSEPRYKPSRLSTELSSPTSGYQGDLRPKILTLIIPYLSQSQLGDIPAHWAPNKRATARTRHTSQIRRAYDDRRHRHSRTPARQCPEMPYQVTGTFNCYHTTSVFSQRFHGGAHKAPQRNPVTITRPIRPLGTDLYSLVMVRLTYLIDPSAYSKAHPNAPDSGTLILSNTLDDLGILVHPHTQGDIQHHSHLIGQCTQHLTSLRN